ncbi:DUF6718 family protein [Enterocloster sp.]|uniref:DUF6718 family protein n=1 Tax=unclassified Enterocloster TaxID=2719314 RepID=UPI003A942F7E
MCGCKNKTWKKLSCFIKKLQEKIRLNAVELVVISPPSAYREQPTKCRLPE